MRIAMIAEQASPLAGGDQHTHVADLSLALSELGHDVRIYTRRTDPSATTTTTSTGVRVVQVPIGPAHPVPVDQLLPLMGEFARWLEAAWRDGWRPEVVHAHFWTSGLAAVTAARQFAVPVVQSFHQLGEIETEYTGPSRTGYERALGRAVDRVFVQSQDEVHGLIRIGVPRAQLAVVPAGVDSIRFSPDGPAVARDRSRPRILSVGKLVDRAGFGDVIQALRYVPKAEMVVVGGPPADRLSTDDGAQKLRALAEQCQVADRVHLVGAVAVEDMPSWYRSADLLVAAGWHDQHDPVESAALEAMACGIPVIGTAAGGLDETLVDGLTGDLVPPRDPRALGSALRRLVNDRVRRFAYATAALDRARQAYSWRRVAMQVGAVYATVTGATLLTTDTEPLAQPS